MTRVYVFCEGQTEETFVREVLYSHFFRLNIWLTPIVLSTSKYGKGGISTYGKIKNQIIKQCKQEKSAWVTTLIDFYGLPKDFPGLKLNQTSRSFNRARLVEMEFQKDINQSNFISHLIIHEFEALLFSSPDAFEKWFDQNHAISELKNIRSRYDTPEHINDGVDSAPSKRILDICNNYQKPLHGSLIALEIGLDVIRKECAYFNSWIKKIEQLVN